MLITEAFDLYRDDFLLLKNRSEKTIESYDVTKKVCAWYFGNASIESLDLNIVLTWIRWLRMEPSPSTGLPRTNNTVRNYVICLRGVLKYLKERGYDVIDPAPIPVPKREEKVPEFLKPDEVEEFLALAGEARRGHSLINRKRNQAIIAMIFNCAPRVSELCRLNQGCFYNGSFTVMGKGGQPGLCFIGDITMKYVNEYLELRTDTNPALFVGKNGERIKPGNVRDVFQNVSKRFGRRVHPHIGRHSLATNLLVNNANPRYVQEILRHKNLATVQVYTHVVNEDLRKIYHEKHKEFS